jgi:hypothetical protein
MPAEDILRRYATLRPLLYHFTAKSNLPNIRDERELHCASILDPSCTNAVRGYERKVRRGGYDVTIRDQRPLHWNYVMLTGGTYNDFLASLGEKVFFWPGNLEGPIDYGCRYSARYSDSIAIRANFLEVVALNLEREPYFCKYNSGAPRPSHGRRSPRGPGTFVSAIEWPHPASDVVEVSFVGSLTLPGTAEVLDGNRWREL